MAHSIKKNILLWIVAGIKVLFLLFYVAYIAFGLYKGDIIHNYILLILFGLYLGNASFWGITRYLSEKYVAKPLTEKTMVRDQLLYSAYIWIDACAILYLLAYFVFNLYDIHIGFSYLFYWLCSFAIGYRVGRSTYGVMYPPPKSYL